jgi:hypothetical protein
MRYSCIFVSKSTIKNVAFIFERIKIIDIETVYKYNILIRTGVAKVITARIEGFDLAR